jgi:hypothetical protein
MAQGFGGLNLEMISDIIYFGEILVSLMHGRFMSFFLKFA